MQQEEQIDIDKLYNQIQTLNKSLDQGECVIFYGPTGVGKTTIFSYLNGFNMEIIDNNKIDILNKQQEDPQIGHGVKAETENPNMKIKNQFFLVDLPGYDDNRSPQQRIINAIINHEIFKYYKKIRFVLILDYRAIQMRSALNIKDLINGVYMNLGYLGCDLVSNVGILINCCYQGLNIQQQLIERYQTYFQDNIRQEELESVSTKVEKQLQFWKSLSHKQIKDTYVHKQNNFDDNQSHIIFLQILRKAKFFQIEQAQMNNNPFTEAVRDNLFDWIKQLYPIDSYTIRPNINTDDQIYFDNQISIYSRKVILLVKESVQKKISYWNEQLSNGIQYLEHNRQGIEILLVYIFSSQFDDVLEWKILNDISKKYSQKQVDLTDIEDDKEKWQQSLLNFQDKITQKRKDFLTNLLDYQKEQRDLIDLNLVCLQDINNFIFNQQLDIQKSLDDILCGIEIYERLLESSQGSIDLKCAKALQDKSSQDYLSSKILQLNKKLDSVLKYDQSLIQQFKFQENLKNLQQSQQQLKQISKIFQTKIAGKSQLDQFEKLKVSFNTNTSQLQSLFKAITPYLSLLQQTLSNIFIYSVRNQSLDISLITRDYINIILIKKKIESNLNLSILE
ncbi:hypothetical protein pb186bvf_001049 [Paramecium bursaria]